MRLLAIKISAIALGGLLFFITLEAGLRLLPYNSGLVAAQVDDNQPVYRFLADRDVRYSQDWDMKNSRIRHINKDGFLSDIEYIAEDDGPLMAVIGDSFVEAIQVDWKASVHGLLYQSLAPDVRVYAFAAAYASLAQYLAWSAYAREAYEPDMLVVNVVGNDFLQILPKPGETFSGGFMGMNFFAEDKDGGLIVRRSDRLPESWLIRLARQSAIIDYAHRNVNITSAPGRIKALFRNLTGPQKEPLYIANTLAEVDDDQLALSKREVDMFLELLPSMSGLAPQSIVITIDGLRPELYEPTLLAMAEDSFPATMA
jgi:hypothetical protein